MHYAAPIAPIPAVLITTISIRKHDEDDEDEICAVDKLLYRFGLASDHGNESGI
jgi:hypothetical protein